MSQKQTIYPIQLSPAEIVFLLSIVQVDQIIGLENDQVSTTSPDTTARLLAQGHQQLIENGWLAAKEPNGPLELDGDLLHIVMAIARPKQVILTQFDRGDGIKQRVVHYWSSNFVVELCEVEGKFDLKVLGTTAAWQRRLIYLLGLPQTTEPNTMPPAMITAGVFQKLTEQTKQALATEYRGNSPAERSFYHAIMSSRGRATLTHITPNHTETPQLTIKAWLWGEHYLWQIKNIGAHVLLSQMNTKKALTDFAY